MKIKKEFYKKILRGIYYYVPPCPCCHSYKTGRFIKYHRNTVNDWVVIDALQNGEIVVPIIDLPEDNCICVSCGFTWDDNVPLKIMTLEQIDEQKNLRETNYMLQQKYEKEMEEEVRMQKKHSKAFNSTIKFLGKF